MNLTKRQPSERSLPKADRTVLLVGNPNVGKSTVFNALTGLNQHTGNWPGKTVETARGIFTANGLTYALVDTPGTYSLRAASAEEEVARDALCFSEPDAVVLVADATALERSLPLVLSVLERTNRAVLCLNLCDEARKKHITVDTDELSLQLGIPVVRTEARSGKGLDELKNTVAAVCDGVQKTFFVRHEADADTEAKIRALADALADVPLRDVPVRFAAVKMLENELVDELKAYTGTDVVAAAGTVYDHLCRTSFADAYARHLVEESARISALCLHTSHSRADDRDARLDEKLTSRTVGIPLMLLGLCGLFWLTVEGANGPSAALSALFSSLEAPLAALLGTLCAPTWLTDALVYGVWRTLGWVVSVMLPPMAIFFPLFTLLEDVGYLPRIAFVCDGLFRRAGAHGKQSLTMCMGFGCNACGVMGCRIIDSPRERRIAVLTNAFVPCNGRFPALISLFSLFCVGRAAGVLSSVYTALLLLGAVLLSVAVTLAVSKLLSRTVCRGSPSSFVLEMPPYRRPQIATVLVRSVFDRTLFVLGRAAAVAAPAGLLLFVLASVRTGDGTLLSSVTSFFDPVGRFFGLDGVILTAFLLGLPANETVIPIMVMAYTGATRLADLSLPALGSLLAQNGWTTGTAACVAVFFLFHFPCATTLKTIYAETKSVPDTVLAAVLPTAVGLVGCLVTRGLFALFG